MARRRHTPEQIIRKLREADRMLGEGRDLAEVARHLEVTEATYHRWRNQFGGMKADDAKRLRELERENTRLKRCRRRNDPPDLWGLNGPKPPRLPDAAVSRLGRPSSIPGQGSLLRRRHAPTLRSGLVHVGWARVEWQHVAGGLDN